MGDASRNAVGDPLLQGSGGVEGRQAGVPSWAPLPQGANSKNTHLGEGFTNVDVSGYRGFFSHVAETHAQHLPLLQ